LSPVSPWEDIAALVSNWDCHGDETVFYDVLDFITSNAADFIAADLWEDGNNFSMLGHRRRNPDPPENDLMPNRRFLGSDPIQLVWMVNESDG
jgi:hypothetical protein